MKIHQLKTLPEYFQLVRDGIKTFEVRKNDRDFKQGDILILQEYDPSLDNPFTGNCITIQTGFILYGGQYGIDSEYCVISLDHSYCYFWTDFKLKNR